MREFFFLFVLVVSVLLAGVAVATVLHNLPHSRNYEDIRDVDLFGAACRKSGGDYRVRTVWSEPPGRKPILFVVTCYPHKEMIDE